MPILELRAKARTGTGQRMGEAIATFGSPKSGATVMAQAIAPEIWLMPGRRNSSPWPLPTINHPTPKAPLASPRRFGYMDRHVS